MIIRRKNHGQAMVEMNIVAAFFLVPLMFMMPLLAKYIDIKISALQAARYQAWEYTVWYNEDKDQSSGFSAVNAPVKTLSESARETDVRFFGQEGQPLSSSTDKNGLNTNELRTYWQDHRGDSLIVPANGDVSDSSGNSRGKTPSLPVIGDIIDFIYDGLNFIFGAIASVLNFIGSSAGFTIINNDAYSNATYQITLTDNGIINPDGNGNDMRLEMNTSAAVLTDNWNAGGVEHVSNQVRGIIPTGILGEIITAFVNLPVIKQLWAVISFFLPEFSSDCLQFGYIEPDNVPIDRVGDGGEVSCDNGVCEYDPEPSPPVGDCSAF